MQPGAFPTGAGGAAAPLGSVFAQQAGAGLQAGEGVRRSTTAAAPASLDDTLQFLLRMQPPAPAQLQLQQQNQPLPQQQQQQQQQAIAAALLQAGSNGGMLGNLGQLLASGLLGMPSFAANGQTPRPQQGLAEFQLPSGRPALGPYPAASELGQGLGSAFQRSAPPPSGLLPFQQQQPSMPLPPLSLPLAQQQQQQAAQQQRQHAAQQQQREQHQEHAAATASASRQEQELLQQLAELAKLMGPTAPPELLRFGHVAASAGTAGPGTADPAPSLAAQQAQVQRVQVQRVAPGGAAPVDASALLAAMTGAPQLPSARVVMPRPAAPLPPLQLQQHGPAGIVAERQGQPLQPNWQVDVKVESVPPDLSSMAIPPLVLPPLAGTAAQVAGGTATPQMGNNLAPGLALPRAADGTSGSPGAAASTLPPPLPQLGVNSAAPGAPPRGARPAAGAGGGGAGSKRKAPASAGGRHKNDRLDDSDSDVTEGGAPGDLTQEDKAAEARRKNREAQQRFRERQRAAAREAEERHQAIVDEMARLRVENRDLEQRNRALSAFLAVRDGMLQAFCLGQPTGAASDSTGRKGMPLARAGTAAVAAAAGAQPAGPAGADAAQQEHEEHQQPPPQQQEQAQAQAREEEGALSMETDAAAEPAAQPGQGDAAAAVDAAEAGAAAVAAAAPAPSSGEARRSDAARAEPARSGSSSGGSACTEVEEVQPASHRVLQDPLAEKKVREIVTVDDYISNFQQFQVELQFSLQLCEENGMTEEDRRAVEAGHEMLKNIWRRIMALNPTIVKTFCRDLSPADGTEGERWEAFAAKVQISDEGLLQLHRAFQRYLRQGMRVAEERHDLQLQLAELLKAHEQAVADVAAGGNAHSAQAEAGRWLEALEVAQGLDALGNRDFDLTMALCFVCVNVLGDFQMAMANAASTPFMPNWVEITRRTLRQAVEQGRLAGEDIQLTGNAGPVPESDLE